MTKPTELLPERTGLLRRIWYELLDTPIMLLIVILGGIVWWYKC